jgi:hypothetical protein
MRSIAKKALVGALAAATLGGAVMTSSTEAYAWHRGYAHGYYGAPYYRHRRSGRGAAVAAGVLGGLALGALAAGAARPAYAAPIAPGYGPCYEVRRRYIDDWGRTIIRRETVCD